MCMHVYCMSMRWMLLVLLLLVFSVVLCDDVPEWTGGVVNGQFEVESFLGSGSYGWVYRGRDVRTGHLVALKAESVNATKSKLPYECDILERIRNISDHIVKLHWCGYAGLHNEYRVLVTDLYGKSLESVENDDHMKDIKYLNRVKNVGRQMVSTLEILHDAGVIHVDIKPANIMEDRANKNKYILIDFNLARLYIRDGRHILYNDGGRRSGTPRYMSFNSMLRTELSRRDDLESLAYVLISLLKPLPWSGISANNTREKNLRRIQARMKESIDTLCEGLPGEFNAFMRHTKSLGFYERPNYDLLRSLLDSM